MGKANRARRKMKEKARRRPAGGAVPHGLLGVWWKTPPEQVRPAQLSPGDLAAEDISAALDALARQDRAGFAAAGAKMADRTGVPGWRKVVERTLTGYLETAISAAWRHGWQPADLVRLARRQLSAAHVRVMTDAIAAELQRYAPATIDPRWTPQLEGLKATVWWRPGQTHLQALAEKRNAAWADVTSIGIEVLDALLRVPVLEMIGPAPGTARPASSAARQRAEGIDQRILTKVRAMLDKAESSEYPAEAESFTAGAQALMARHSIDVALLAAVSDDGPGDPLGRRISIDNPYEGPKAMLLSSVARANRCQTVWTSNLGFSTVVGFPADLDAVEMLFTSLLIQAVRAMTQSGSRSDRYGRSRTRAFRQSFLTSFATRIGERLTETIGREATAAATESPSVNLLPVLAARDHAVEAAVGAMFPQLTHKVLGSVTDYEGWASGRSAADLANLGGGASALDAAGERTG